MPSERSPNPNASLIVALLLTAVFALGIVDFFLDSEERDLHHLAGETLFLLIILGTAIYMGVGWQRARDRLGSVTKALEQRRTERDAWKGRAQKLLRGLGEAVDEQMREWELTAAERETALFLLKGYSHKEIARLTDRSERTVRQHAVVVYRKSGLGGRAELSAFFLEDLLLPMDSGPVS